MNDPVEIGDRIKLVRCYDPYTRLASGIVGTVKSIDDMGTVHVRWDNGSNLGLIPEHDQWEKVIG